MSCQNHALNDGHVPMTQGLIHIKIECSSCDWFTDDYKTGMAEAKDHHETTGHDLAGESGYNVRIGAQAHDRLSRQLAQRLGPKIAADLGIPVPNNMPATA